MRNLFSRLFLCILLVFSSTTNAHVLTAKQFAKKPKLVLLIVIDQLKGDQLTRFADRFERPSPKSQGGFRFLMERGAWFPQAQFALLQNMTAPGHATLLTGAYPYRTGIPINSWFDPASESRVYCTEDPSFEWLSGKTS